MRRFQPVFGLVVALLFAAGLARAQSVPLAVDARSREDVRLFFKGVYPASDNVPMAWTGNHQTGVSGDTSAAYKEAVRLRINFFRALVGVSGNVTLNPALSLKDQDAALMMSANRALDHNPPASWTFYTAAGNEAARNSNLYIGKHGPDAITGYIADHGDNNRAVGHRRWIFYPQTTQMGTGDVPGTSTILAANALWILDPSLNGRVVPRPGDTRTLYTTYPTEGYMPYPLVWPRWSFSHPGASFANATVTMTRGGQSVAVGDIYRGDNDLTGEPTIVWVYDNQDSREPTPHVRPTADTTYTVTVANVLIGGTARSFTYNVTVFDPEVPTAGAANFALSGPTAPTVGEAATYTVAKPAAAGGLDWRMLTTAPYATVYNAESGLADLRTTVNAGYNVVQTVSKAAGNAAYYLAHPNPRADQVIQLPDTLYVTGSSAAVTFASRLGFASSEQVAHVQLSVDDGASWQDIHVQPGTTATSGANAPTETAFVRRTLPLSAYVGRTLQVRFIYTAGNGPAFPQSDPADGAGWFIDDISVTGVEKISAATPTRLASAGTFAFNATAAGLTLVQARGVMFGAYPLEWGPVSTLNVRPATGSVSTVGRIINLSILTSLAGGDDKMDMGYVVGGVGTSGAKPLVIRAAGPSLSVFGLSGLLADPKIDLVSGGAAAGGNDNWGGGATLRDALAAVGAFAFTGPASLDAAVATSINTRNNSVAVTSANGGSGQVLAEIYDATPADQFTATTQRLINVSVLKPIGEGLTAGFVIGGTTPVRVLVRAVGPKLASFGLSGTVPDPQLTLKGAGGVQVAFNDNWSGTELENAANAVGAFPLDSGAKDAAIVITLQPGSYSAEVKGIGGSGIALVEVYEVP